VTTGSKEEAEVKAESTDVGTRLAADVEDAEIALKIKFEELVLVDGSHTELTLDGRDERRTLEESTGEGLDGTSHLGLGLDCVVKTENGNVLLTCALLGFDETCGSVYAHKHR